MCENIGNKSSLNFSDPIIEVGSLEFLNKAADQIEKISSRKASAVISQRCRKRDAELRGQAEEAKKRRAKKNLT